MDLHCCSFSNEIDGYYGGVRFHLASLVEEFRRHAAETAVVAHRGNRRYATTYGELAELAGRSAADLERRGIAVGDRVVFWGENSAEWLGVFFGCLLRGVIAVPLDAAGSTEFASRVVKDVSPKLIVGDRGLLASLQSDVPRLLLYRNKRAAAREADVRGERCGQRADAVSDHLYFRHNRGAEGSCSNASQCSRELATH